MNVNGEKMEQRWPESSAREIERMP